MAFSLDGMFSPEFFLAEGEPYDRSDFAVNKDGKPVSLWSAIGMALENEDERKRIEDVIGWNEDKKNKIDITPEVVYDHILKTDTCGTLEVPVDCYIDEDGWVTIDVYDER
jgi:hypothetical protein